MDKKEFQITADGSHTLYVSELDETYHSKHGAIQEALHVFIGAGINHFNQKNLKILEIGFGTGLNAFLTLLEAKKQGIQINYTSIEAYPLELSITNQLNYTQKLKSTNKEKEWFQLLHQSKWEKHQKITTRFSLTKTNIDLANYPIHEKFDIIYFDAFGPRVQPEMWSKSILKKMYSTLSSDGILVTYCAKGSVKRTLKEVGFKIENLPGPPGKREMTRAVKINII